MKSGFKQFRLQAVVMAGLIVSNHASASSKLENWTLDASHTQIGFEISHLVIATVEGRFNKFKGGFKADRQNNKVKDLNINIDVASIDTNEADRDKHLRGPDFFDAKRYNNITFKADSVEFSKDKPVAVTGELTIRDKTKKITLNIDWKGEVTDPWGNQKAVFNLHGKIRRQDFGLSWNKTLDRGGLMIGDFVTLNIRVEANKVENE